MIFTYLPFTYNPQTLLLIPTVFLLELIEFSKYTIVYQKISFLPFLLHDYNKYYYNNNKFIYCLLHSLELNDNDDNRDPCLFFYLKGS